MLRERCGHFFRRIFYFLPRNGRIRNLLYYRIQPLLCYDIPKRHGSHMNLTKAQDKFDQTDGLWQTVLGFSLEHLLSSLAQTPTLRRNVRSAR